jgi:RNA polymerase sigma factor (sigma-70 family)
MITQEVLDRAYQVAAFSARESGKYHLLDEMNAAAIEGVAMAATTWDPSAGVPFVSFACIRARGACQDLLRHWYGRPNRASGPKMQAANIDLHEMGIYDTASGIDDSAELRWFGLTQGPRCEYLIERIKEILNPKQWEALSTYLTGDTLQSVADKLGLTESRASQLRQEAIARLVEHRDELSLFDPRAA